ncbi:MAG: type II toxin-antitoxin system VapC family toxin [Promethearchaeota archaeon]
MVFVDSDIIISSLKPKRTNQNLQARKIISSLFTEFGTVKTTVFNYAELLRGAYLSTKVSANLQLIERFLTRFEIVYPTEKTIQEFARISATLQLKGGKIGIMDELIASIVVVSGDILYTHNLRHFERVPMLSLLDWYTK